jgi:N-acetyl-anhydromuramyl-L-alanine amidase AmpD
MRRLIAVAAALLFAGCASARYGRTVLPPQLAGPRPPIDESHRTPIDAERVRLTREYLAIHDPQALVALPDGDGVEAIAFTPRLIVVHYTAKPTLAESLAEFAPLEIDAGRELVAANGRLNVGVQFVVDRGGEIYALYPETAIARHAIGLNPVAIGIENVGDADLGERGAGKAPLTAAQLRADAALVRHLVGAHPTIRYLIGHQDYRELEDPRHPAHALFHEAVPGYRTEKKDPGHRFLRRLRRELGRP